MSEPKAKPVWEELDYKHDAIVEASAGTGKTYALEHIVEQLVNNGIDIRNLLLVTFTEKAAGELRERIRKILADSKSENGIKAAKQLDEATICTIHSFCQELLREYPFESGMQMASDVVTSDRVLIERAVQSVMTGLEFKRKYETIFVKEMNKWNEEQDGQGLSRAASNRVAAIVQSGLDAKSWWEKHVVDIFASYRLLIGQIVDEITQRSGGVDPGAYICSVITFNDTKPQQKNKQAFGQLDNQLRGLDQVRLESNDIRTRGVPMLAEIGRMGVTFGICDASGEKIIGEDGQEVKFNQRYPLYAKLKAIAVKVSKKIEEITILDSLGEMAYDKYLRLKRRSRTMTFDDMVLETSRAVKDAVADKENPAKQAFLKNIRSRYRIALVDEFQDTDDKQWTIFNSLFSSKVNIIEEAQTKQGCLIVVGDPKQAIYSFRGADIGTYLMARREIQTGGGQVLSLEKMYRSTEEMVNAYNKIFDKPKDQVGKPIEGAIGWFDNMHANGDPIEYARVSFPKEKPPKDVKDFKYPDSDAAVELLESLPEGATADNTICLPLYLENMTEEMLRLHNDEFWKGKMSWSSMCVLVRSHANGRAAQAALRSKGIPCRIYKEAGLFDSAEAESVLALFDYLAMPRRAGNLAALLLTPFFDVPLSRIEARLSVGDVAFDRLCDRWRTYIAKCEWVKFFESAMNDTALGKPHFVIIEGKARIDGDCIRHRSGIRQIFDQLLVKCGRSRDLSAFSDALRSWQRDDAALDEAGSVRNKESEADAVQIMTMHAAKGLEFSAVFVAAGFSGFKSGTTKQEKLEERRLFYVALTRAKYKLYLPWSKRASELDVWKGESALATFLGQGILYLYGDAEAKAKVKGVDTVPNDADVQKNNKGTQMEGATSPDLPPTLGMKGWRFKWDSFSSLNHHGVAKPIEQKQKSLVPKGALSGTVFHEVMERLCKNDKAKDEVDFEIGKEDNFDKLIEETEDKKSPLLEIVRRRLAANDVVNQVGDGETTASTIARMAWNALRTELDFGDDKFRLYEIAHENRKAEVNFVLDEKLLLAAGTDRDGALNGSIDLLIKRDDGYYIIDWKTNTLDDYNQENVGVAMDNAGYHDQYRIYTLAAEKWLGGEVVRGAAYLFVRRGEFGESPSGVYVHTMKEGERAEFATGLVKRIGESDEIDEENDKENM